MIALEIHLTRKHKDNKHVCAPTIKNVKTRQLSRNKTTDGKLYIPFSASLHRSSWTCDNEHHTHQHGPHCFLGTLILAIVCHHGFHDLLKGKLMCFNFL